VQVHWFLSEEVGTETFVGVEKDSVDVIIELGRDVLGQELNLIDQVGSLGLFGRSGLSGLSVVGFDSLLNIAWFNFSDIEAGSEGGVEVVRAVEEIVEGSCLQVLMFLVNFGQDDWGHADGALKSSSLSLSLIGNLGKG